ncbi:hypothetical protein D9547_14425, partial [Geobacillus stearothermophilus]
MQVLFFFFFFFFFFQAEDGIRVFCLSRGLGDVYKEQVVIRDKQQRIGMLHFIGIFVVAGLLKPVVHICHFRQPRPQWR